MPNTQPAGLLHLLTVYEHPTAHRMVCHAHSISLERGVFPGDSVLPANSPPGAATAPPGCREEIPTA
ncbi:hypothetical protein ACWDR2_39510 [Streptomyces sp. NPDC003631]|uniref:hypothetical protein n=1 Tax=Streptomyces TaxID=1883 RepID=UPI0031ED3C9D